MVSIIVPVYNESKNVEKFIKNIEYLEGNYEIIFVDGGSSDGTVQQISKKFKCFKTTKGRANQMNHGVNIAKGNIFLFLHLDSILDVNAVTQVYKTMENSKVGCFKTKFNSEKAIMKICGWMSNFRVRVRNIAFGDQGIFIDRELFFKIGGFKDIPIMEDYQLSLDIAKLGYRFTQADSYIVTDDRRFRANGYIKTMALMQKLQSMYRKGVPPEKIEKHYRDER